MEAADREDQLFLPNLPPLHVHANSKVCRSHCQNILQDLGYQKKLAVLLADRMWEVGAQN